MNKPNEPIKLSDHIEGDPLLTAILNRFSDRIVMLEVERVVGSNEKSISFKVEMFSADGRGPND